MNRESTHVLIVEDEEAHALLVRRAFESAPRPVDVTVAQSLRIARDKLAEDVPDLVLVDLHLPDGKGIELLPKEDGLPRYPIVIMPSHGDEQMAVDALKAGALDYVVKSYEVLADMPRIADRALREWRHVIEREEAERALRESEERLQAILDNAPTVVYVKDLEGRYLTINRRFEQLFKIARGDVVGKTDHDFLPPETADMFQAHDRKVIAAGTSREFDEVATHDDGVHTYISVKFPLSGAAGEVYAVCSISTDITERKRADEERAILEAQLRQAKKLETIGTLAGGIAHDFNNILTPILGFGEMALEEIPPDNPAHSDLQHVLKGASRARDLVQHILIFSRQAEPERRLVKIQAIIEEALQLLGASLPTTIEIRTEIDPECGAVWADSTQLLQLLMNLGTNSYHAMRDSGGILEVKLDTVEAESTSHADLPGGAYARLSVSDTGHGMDRETLERIFDPFFTKKGVQEGTGLGLSVVHGIVMGHEGEITIDSGLGKGTTIRVYLPLAQEEVEPEAAEEEVTPRGDERVLLVDDEEEVALIEKEMLERLGYRVTVKVSSPEALETFRQGPHEFDVVVTDQTMPRLTGAQLAREMLAIRPDLPIILTTGFSETLTPEESRKIGIREYLLKPLVRHEIGKAIRKTLDRQTEES